MEEHPDHDLGLGEDRQHPIDDKPIFLQNMLFSETICRPEDENLPDCQKIVTKCFWLFSGFRNEGKEIKYLIPVNSYSGKTPFSPRK
jgi:hypothetical protein